MPLTQRKAARSATPGAPPRKKNRRSPPRCRTLRQRFDQIDAGDAFAQRAAARARRQQNADRIAQRKRGPLDQRAKTRVALRVHRSFRRRASPRSTALSRAPGPRCGRPLRRGSPRRRDSRESGSMGPSDHSGRNGAISGRSTASIFLRASHPSATGIRRRGSRTRSSPTSPGWGSACAKSALNSGCRFAVQLRRPSPPHPRRTSRPRAQLAAAHVSGDADQPYAPSASDGR